MNTPRANRLHIGIFGRRNAGKSSLINALTGQKLAIVSDTPGTTADPVYKSMELHPIGPVVFIDTAGFDDEGELGQLRVEKTRGIISRTDVAIMVIDGTAPLLELEYERSWMTQLKNAKIPTITVINKWDAPDDEKRAEILRTARNILSAKNLFGAADTHSGIATGKSKSTAAGPDSAGSGSKSQSGTSNTGGEIVIPLSAKTGDGIDALRRALQDALPEEYMQDKILGELLEDGSLVLLVMPQDIQAPKGRLILPQVQTLRELLDRKCTVMSTTTDGYAKALAALNRAPDLIITDSQCFGEVYAQKPESSALTSFSILMAASKGDIHVFADGVSAIDDALQKAAEQQESPSAESALFRVLIAEACTHVPLNEDIGTIKIPRLLQKTFGDRVDITSVRGGDFPDVSGLKQYDLIIHCGACMFNRRHVMSRIAAAQEAGVPITNYGIFLAKMTGILDKVSLPSNR